MSTRFHLDPKGWFQPGRVHAHLKAVAEAVWSETRIEVRYESWTQIVDRVLEPFGLVLKGGIWYVVARREDVLRTYRLSGILALLPTADRFERPADFDLARFWAETTGQFEKDIYVATARVRATARGRKLLMDISQPVRDAVIAAGIAEAEDWAELTIPIEEIGWACREMTRIGAEIEVLAPPELRARLAEQARCLADLYGV